LIGGKKEKKDANPGETQYPAYGVVGVKCCPNLGVDGVDKIRGTKRFSSHLGRTEKKRRG